MTVNCMESVGKMMKPYHAQLALAAKKFGSIYNDVLWRIKDRAVIDYIDSCPALTTACVQLISNNKADHLTALFADWRLPLLAWLDQYINDTHIAKTINLITWLQQNKTFFQDWINRDEKLYNWLSNNTLESIVLTNVTTTIYSLSKVTKSQNGLIMPALMDVSALWQSHAALKTWENHQLTKCKKLLSTTYDSMASAPKQLMFSADPSAISAFMSSFTDKETPSGADDNLNVHPDILRCMMLLHTDNKALLDVLIKARPALNNIIKSYANSKSVTYLPNAKARRQEKRHALPPANQTFQYSFL